jgi:hypothetical protein
MYNQLLLFPLTYKLAAKNLYPLSHIILYNDGIAKAEPMVTMGITLGGLVSLI